MSPLVALSFRFIDDGEPVIAMPEKARFLEYARSAVGNHITALDFLDDIEDAIEELRDAIHADSENVPMPESQP